MDLVGQALQKIKEAQFVLVGIGELCDKSIIPTDEKNKYRHAVSKAEDQNWILPFIMREYIEDEQSEAAVCQNIIYEELYKILQNKNYFIVSVCMDSKINNSQLMKDRIVEPCGSFRKMQCSNSCCDELYDIPDTIVSDTKGFINNVIALDAISAPVCSKCGAPLAFNNLRAEQYNEEGYMKQWNVYTKWLQGTINKKVCILELGVGMKYPTVIRWPFERVAYFNQSAFMFRVHNRLYQTTEEIKDRSAGICMMPEEFLKELSNRY